MKTNWQTKKLGNLLELCDAGTWGEEYPKGLPLLRSTNMQNGNLVLDDVKTIALPKDKIDQYTLLEGDILMTKSSGSVDHIGKSLFITSEMSGKYGFSNFTQRLRPDKSQVLPMWIYYKVSDPATRDFLLGASQTTTGLRNLKISQLKELEIPLPPLATQHKIVAILDEKFAKLREAKRLRQDAIVDTEKILAATLREIFEEGKEKGWEELDFGNEDYLKIIDGDRGKNYPTKDQFTQDGYCLFLNTSNVRKGNFDFRKMDFITKEKDESLRKGKVSRGDIILTTRGTLGNSAYYDNSIPYDNVRINSGMIVLRTDHKKVLPQYLIYIINSNEFIKKVQEANSGSAQPQLPIKVLSKLSFPLPPLAEQQKIVTRLDALSEKLRTLRELQQSQLEDMKKLEKAYLREAFRGGLV